jgi:hypothetical protein
MDKEIIKQVQHCNTHKYEHRAFQKTAAEHHSLHKNILQFLLCNSEVESLPTDTSMFTIPWMSPASLRYLLAADLRERVGVLA